MINEPSSYETRHSSTEFADRVGSLDLGEGSAAEGWYTDSGEFFFGVLIARPAEGTWGYRLFAPDQYLKSWSIDHVRGLQDRRSALDQLYVTIEARLRRPQRVFPREAGVEEAPPAEAE